MVKKLIHLEGLTLFVYALYLYYHLHANWLIFVLLLFTPDISMIGYLRGKRLGATIYNLVHNYILGILIIIVGELLFKNSLITSIGIILLAHVGLDRFLGFGLKYPKNFKETHIQKL